MQLAHSAMNIVNWCGNSIEFRHWTIGGSLWCSKSPPDCIVPLQTKLLELSGTEKKALRNSKAKDVTFQSGGDCVWNFFGAPAAPGPAPQRGQHFIYIFFKI
jgi:hypothetical protein